MQLSTEIRRAGFALLALQFVTAVVGIWMLERTAPAIERIMAENVETLRAVQSMQRGLLERDAAPDGSALETEGMARFDASLQHAIATISESEEHAVLEAIDTEAKPMRSATGARVPTSPALLDGLDELAEVNRQSMDRARADAHRLASAGGWALSGLALATVFLSIRMIRRANDRILAPVHHLREVAIACQSGETLRRCEGMGMPDELRQVASTMNRLLDAQVRHRSGRGSKTREQDKAGVGPEAVTDLLEHIPGALALFDDKETPLACTVGALPRLQALKDAATRAKGSGTHQNGAAEPSYEVIEISGGYRLVRGA